MHLGKLSLDFSDLKQLKILLLSLYTPRLCFVIFVQAATFALGNAAYHSDSLYKALTPAVPLLVDSLTDSVARTRANAAGENLANSLIVS